MPDAQTSAAPISGFRIRIFSPGLVYFGAARRLTKTPQPVAASGVSTQQPLRHAAGYTLANEGVDTRLIQDFLGHADIRHTAHYTALSPRRLAAVRVR